MKNMLEEVLLPKGKLLIAVSGGVDSMVLLYLVAQLGKEAVVAHVNHNLRREESDKEERLVRYAAQILSYPLEVKRLPEGALDAPGQSLQMLARKERYQFFLRVAAEHNCSSILTAHHADDNLETLLLQFISSGGISSFLGIPEVGGYTIPVHRPLLLYSKAQIVEFAQQNEVDFLNDSSNAKDGYKRNYIRNRIIPLIKKIQPAVTTNVQRGIEERRAALILIDRVAEQKREEYHHPQSIKGMLTLSKTVLKDKLISPLLIKTIFNYKLNYTQAIDLLQSVEATELKQFILEDDYVLFSDRSSITVHHQNAFKQINVELALQEDQPYELVLPHSSFRATYCSEGHALEQNPTTEPAYSVLVDADMLQGKSLQLKTPLGNERMEIKGGSKKVSRILIDQKLPYHLRKLSLLLLADNEVVAIFPCRSSKNFAPKELGRPSWLFTYSICTSSSPSLLPSQSL